MSDINSDNQRLLGSSFYQLKYTTKAYIGQTSTGT